MRTKLSNRGKPSLRIKSKSDPELKNLKIELQKTKLALAAEVKKRKGTEAQILAAQRAHADLEAKVAERAEQLERINHELEAFTYSVSHDLRAPLRAIEGFARLLRDDTQSNLNANGIHFLQHICTGTKQMGQLIEDLLSFSRLGRKPMTLRPVNMAELAADAISDAQGGAGTRVVEAVIALLPAAMGDRAMLRQVFINLISNAFKFTRKTERARVEVGSYSAPGETVYFVRDNGAGFDMEYARKLFGVFQRLHSSEEFDGTGVGLAIVQRVVHRHGGRVWAEGKVDSGATFFFSLPEKTNCADSPGKAE